jgi:hypothetical protein
VRAHWRYLQYVLRHKWYVLLAGIRTGAPLWRLFIHDWSKFTPVEWGAYVRWFYGGDRSSAAKVAFDRAWNHHQKLNKHHWQYWLLTTDQPEDAGRFALQSMDGGIRSHVLCDTEAGRRMDLPQLALGSGDQHESDERYRLVTAVVRQANRIRALPMPEKYIQEMVADWAGAGRAITGEWEVAAWYRRNAAGMILHPATRARVERLLSTVSFGSSPAPTAAAPATTPTMPATSIAASATPSPRTAGSQNPH